MRRSRWCIELAVTYTDSEIDTLVREPKRLPANWRARTQLRPKRGHQERQLNFPGSAGAEFSLILRKSLVNPLDFSAILAVHVPRSNRLFRLRRYNGRSHEHTNHIEADRFYDFHIHLATQRYQEIGSREDAYAEITDRYTDIDGAIQSMFEDAGFEVPPVDQPLLF